MVDDSLSFYSQNIILNVTVIYCNHLKKILLQNPCFMSISIQEHEYLLFPCLTTLDELGFETQPFYLQGVCIAMTLDPNPKLTQIHRRKLYDSNLDFYQGQRLWLILKQCRFITSFIFKDCNEQAGPSLNQRSNYTSYGMINPSTVNISPETLILNSVSR